MQKVKYVKDLKAGDIVVNELGHRFKITANPIQTSARYYRVPTDRDPKKVATGSSTDLIKHGLDTVTILDESTPKEETLNPMKDLINSVRDLRTSKEEAKVEESKVEETTKPLEEASLGNPTSSEADAVVEAAERVAGFIDRSKDDRNKSSLNSLKGAHMLLSNVAERIESSMHEENNVKEEVVTEASKDDEATPEEEIPSKHNYDKWVDQLVLAIGKNQKRPEFVKAAYYLEQYAKAYPSTIRTMKQRSPITASLFDKMFEVLDIRVN